MSRALACGINSVQQMLRHSPHRVIRLWSAKESRNSRSHDLVNQARCHDIPVEITTRKALDKLGGDTQHQDIIIEISSSNPLSEQILYDSLEKDEQKNWLFLLLDGIEDPHNLGACLRTAEAAGVDGVVICSDHAASITTVVRKVASGAADIIPVYRISNLVRCLKRLKQAGVWIYGASDHSDQLLHAIKLSGSVAWVMGAEGKGLRRLTSEQCDELVKIPMHGCVESLNVSVATGVCLYETRRQIPFHTRGVL